MPFLTGISPSVAAVATDAVTTSYHAVVKRGRVQTHEVVVLFGLGGLGFNGLEVVRNIGARVIVTDVKQDRLEEAARLGIPQEDIVPVAHSVQEFIKERGLLGKIDVTLDFVGKHQTFGDAQQIGRSFSLHKSYAKPILTLRSNSSPRWPHDLYRHTG